MVPRIWAATLREAVCSTNEYIGRQGKCESRAGMRKKRAEPALPRHGKAASEEGLNAYR